MNNLVDAPLPLWAEILTAVFVVLGGRPVLWWLFHTPGGGPSISDSIDGINALLTKGYKLQVADVGGKK